MESRRGARAMRRACFSLLSLCVMLECMSMVWANAALTPPSGLVASTQQVTMPTFRLPSVDGGMINSSTLHGKVVVVRFWATW